MKLSVAICTYNGSKYLDLQIRSILSQTYPVDEIVVSDDRSTDSTIDIVESYMRQFPAIFKVFVNCRNLGTNKNFENAISRTTGDITFLSDQDDIWMPDKVERIVSYFQKFPEKELVFSNGQLINEEGEEIGSTLWNVWGFINDEERMWINNKIAFRELMKNHNKATGATMAFRRSLKNIAIPIKVPAGFWHDGWFAMHSAARNSLGFIDDNLIFYRIHEHQQVGVYQSNRPVRNLNNSVYAVPYNTYKLRLMIRYSNFFSREEKINEVKSLVGT